MSRRSHRIYSTDALEDWFQRLQIDWEAQFKPGQLNRGRSLYRKGSVRQVELNKNLAIVHCDSNGSQVYAVVEWGEGELRIRNSVRDAETGTALAIAGLYEIEELIAEEISPVERDPVELNESVEGDNGTEGSQPPVGKIAKAPIKLSFFCVEDGLAFKAFWQDEADGETLIFPGNPERTVNGKDPLSRERRQALIELTSMAHRHGFRFEAPLGLFLLEGSDRFLAFLNSGLAEWRDKFTLRLDKEVRNLLKGAQQPEMRAETTITGALSDARIQWKLVLGDATLTRRETAALLRRDGKPTVLRRHGLLHLSRRQLDTISVLREHSGTIQPYEIFSILEDKGIKIVLDERLARWKDSVSSPPPKLAGLPGQLRPYQRMGVEWMEHLTGHQCGVLLADEMGLGKTLQVLTLLDRILRKTTKPCLIVCPASVVPVWKSEAQKFFPNMSMETLGSRHHFLNRPNVPIWIASYTQLRRHRQLLNEAEFEVSVLDEAQQIKNPDAKVSRACYSIQANRKIALTGTPVENSQLDLWSIFRFLMPGLLPPRNQFIQYLKRPPTERAHLEKILRLQVAPFLLRRTKNKVARDLPEKIESELICELSEPQRRHYTALAKQALDRYGDHPENIPANERLHFLSLLTRLRQVCCDPRLIEEPRESEKRASIESPSGKTGLLMEKISEIFSSGHKVVVFSQFVRYLKILAKSIERVYPTVPLFELTGSTRNRQEPVDQFQRSLGPATMLISLKAGGVGITLHAADYVFIMDPWWNPSVEHQAVDRVHRIGQSHPVMVYRIIARQTVEESVMSLKGRKAEIFDGLIGKLDDRADFASDFRSLRSFLGPAELSPNIAPNAAKRGLNEK